MSFGKLPVVLTIVWTLAAAALAVPAAAAESSAPPSKVTVQSLPAVIRDAPQPLAPIVAWTGQAAAKVEKEIHDYTAVLAKRDIPGAQEPEYVFIKVRHQPFSVYAYVLSPPKEAGKEGIYVEGRNDGKLVGHTIGWLGKLSGTVSLDPTGTIALDGHRHPITETGILHLIRQIEAFARKNVGQRGCTVEALPGSVNGRKATCVRVAFPLAAAQLQAYLIRVFIDDELQIPIRYECYEWPRADGAAPVLQEEFTYLDLRLNPGLTDADFDSKNKNYAFP
jgi:hypothetical protein